jgi:NAD(P)-dependent dehydrogenase (short-subunit alcohol dehydrogenase family)
MSAVVKTALIVGAGRGLGLGLTQEFVARGWRVVATIREPARAPVLAALAGSADPAVMLERVDIERPDEVAALAQRLAGQRFDLVFLSAGIAGPAHQSIERATPEEIGRLFYANAIAPIGMARLFAANVAEPDGVLAFMSSRAGSVAEESSGRRVLYRASKAALNSLTRSFVTELGGRAITVLSMHPGWVRTDMGGADAPVDVATSAAGLADVIECRAGSRKHVFVDYEGVELPW